MKKQTRISRAKLVERAKTTVIVLLFLSCLYLGFQVFEIYREQTTFDGYRQNTSSVANYAGNGNGDVKNVITCFEELSRPELIVAGNNEFRKTVDDRNGTVNRLVQGIVRELYHAESEELSEVVEEEVISALETDWLYVKFPSERSVAYETAFYNVKNSTIQKSTDIYNDMFILPHTGEAIALIYLKDLKSGNWVKTKISDVNAQEISELIKNSADSHSGDNSFAYELNREYRLNEGASLAPLLLLPVDNEQFPIVSVSVPKLYKAGLSFSRPTDFSIGLANIFRYNPNTIRQYVTGEGVLMFVGETGTLGVHPDGLVEYKALDASVGLVISTASDNNVQETLTGVYGIVEQIQRLSGIQQNERCEIRITKMPGYYANHRKYELGFDYYVNGIKVDFGDTYGAWAVVENGTVVEFKMQVKEADTQLRNAQIGNLTDAIKSYCHTNPDYTAIIDTKPVYRFLENEQEITAEWQIKGVK